MKRLAVVASGWHFPFLFFKQMQTMTVPAGWQVDFFCVSHRNPSFASHEKESILSNIGNGRRAFLDRQLYQKIASIQDIEDCGWVYIEKPNTIGDWGNANQWFDDHDYRVYDAFLFTHDDNYLPTPTLFTDILARENWLIVTNSIGQPHGYLRGSFEFFSREMLEIMGGRFDLHEVQLERHGETATPTDFTSLSDWNHVVFPLQRLLDEKALWPRVQVLSPYYRVSTYCIEGERGLMSYTSRINTLDEEQGLDLLEKNDPHLFAGSTRFGKEYWRRQLYRCIVFVRRIIKRS